MSVTLGRVGSTEALCRFQLHKSGVYGSIIPNGWKKHACVSRRVWEVSRGLHLLLTLFSCVIGEHMCSPLHWIGPGGGDALKSSQDLKIQPGGLASFSRLLKLCPVGPEKIWGGLRSIEETVPTHKVLEVRERQTTSLQEATLALAGLQASFFCPSPSCSEAVPWPLSSREFLYESQ